MLISSRKYRGSAPGLLKIPEMLFLPACLSAIYVLVAIPSLLMSPVVACVTCAVSQERDRVVGIWLDTRTYLSKYFVLISPKISDFINYHWREIVVTGISFSL